MSDTTHHHEPLRLEVPLGSRVLVKSGFRLDVSATEASTKVCASLAAELDRWPGTGMVILTGDLFADAAATDAAAEVLASHPALEAAITRFLATPGRSFLVLPGARDASLGTSAGRDSLTSLGVKIPGEVLLVCATAAGVREVLVTASSSTDRLTAELNTLAAPEGPEWLEGIDRLDDPRAARRFATSRALYRHLSHLLWIPALVALLAALMTHFAVFSNRLRRMGQGRERHVLSRVATATWRDRILVTLIVIVLVELLAGLIAVLLARRVFANDSLGGSSDPERGLIGDEAESAPQNVDQAIMDIARSQVAVGRTGVIVADGATPSLTHLDAGFLIVPGASTIVLREHRGRFGLPPVFLAHRQETAVLLETGAELHLQLLIADEKLASENRLERLLANDTVGATPPVERGLRLVAAWPLGGSWPPPLDLATTQRRGRRIRRFTALAIFLTGLLDLLVAVAPPLRDRLHTVLTYLPLGVSQTAATAVAITGIALVMLSRGILRGQRRAWLVAVTLLGLSMVLHLAHEINVAAVLVTGGVLVLLVVERRWFAATTDRSSLSSALPTLVVIVVVAIGAAFAGVELSNLHKGNLEAWPLVLFAVTERLVGLSTVALPDRIEDFVYPTMFAVGIMVTITLLYLITRPVVDRRLSSRTLGGERKIAEIRARDIVKRHGRETLDYFALRDDKQFFFYGDSLVAYAVYGGVALISPDPIGPEAERTQVWAAFRAFCDSNAWGVGVIGAAEEWLPIYSESGMRYVYLGDEAVVDVQRFSLEGGKMKGLRQANTRLARNGYTVEFLDPAVIDPARVPGLIDLMGLNRRGEGERGFSMMLGRLFDPKDTGLLLTVVCTADGTPAAMCQFVPSPAINGYSLDLMRRDPGDHPNGLLDYTLCQTIEHLQAEGASGLSLNFSAFRSTLDGERGEGLTQRIERWGLKKISAVLPIETLWRFNEKYMPNWLARHLVYSAPEYFVPVVAAALRAESITEIPVLGRFLAQDPSNRPGTVVPPELLEAISTPTSTEIGA